MSLSSALDTGASGLDSAALGLGVIGNNIANADTIGFKEGQADFQEVEAEVLIGGGGDLGLGVSLQSVQQILTQGSLTTTGNPTDMAIQGSGFFVVNGIENGQQANYYTRDGQFTVNANGDLVTQGGLAVQGFQADAAGNIGGTLGDLQVGTAASLPNPTANITVKANLDAGATPIPNPGFNIADPVDTSNFSTGTTIYDSLGDAYPTQIYFTENSAGSWSWNAVTNVAGAATLVGTGTLTFNASGQLTAVTGSPSNFNPPGANPQTINWNFGDPIPPGTGLLGVTNFAGTSAAQSVTQDGYATGSLSSINVDSSGVVTGSFSNGQTLQLGQIAVASFATPDQLQVVGGNLFLPTGTSGQPNIGTPGTVGKGTIVDGSLEQSNVDTADQLVDMISTQRDYQADAQVVTTADQMLQTLITSVQQG